MKRIKDLIATQRTSEELEEEPIVLEHISTKKEWEEQQDDPAERAEVLASVTEDMYREDIDPSLQLLQELPESIDMIALEEQRKKMKLQLYYVGRHFSDLVLGNQEGYANELNRVIDLEQELQRAFAVTVAIRFSVKRAQHGLAEGSISLLGYYSQRHRLLELLNTLKTVKTLHQTDEKLRELVEKEHFPEAIQLCQECQHAAVTYRQFNCIQDLSSKLKDTALHIEEKLDEVLALMCVEFDYARYHKITKAYVLLGKLQSAMDQLHMHFTSAVHSRTYEVVYRYASITSVDQKHKYEDLCKNVPLELYIPCLTHLLKMLFGIMCSYHKMLSYHYSESSCSESLSQFDRNYVQQKLQLGLGRLWMDVQHKIHPYLMSQDLSLFQFDDFIKVLDLVNRLILVGEEFCGTSEVQCALLRDPLRAQSIQYFFNYHRARAEELSMFLANELWELWPVRPTFTTLQLKEFGFMRSKKSEKARLNESREGYFTSSTSPFDFTEDVDEEEIIADEVHSDEEEADELKQDFVDERIEEKSSHIGRKRKPSAKVTFHNSSRDGPILTNTTLNVLRYLGKYMQMMHALKPIAFDVLISMSQLFEYYMYAIYVFFSSTNVENSNPKLAQLLHKIQDTIVMGDEGPVGEGLCIPQPFLSSLISLHNSHDLFGLKERLVATESLVFLASQFDLWKSYLDQQIPADKKSFLEQFYNQTLPLSRELREAVYSGVASKSMNYAVLQSSMNSVRWDVKELMCEPNSYVTMMLQEMEGFQSKLSSISGFVPFPVEVFKMLWSFCIGEMNNVFVEGFGGAKKCTHEGRAWMQLDFQQFISQLDRFIVLKPVPRKEHVETFIKAYYLTEGDLENWIRENYMKYSSKQLNSIISCTTPQLSKLMQRNRLSGIVDELQRK